MPSDRPVYLLASWGRRLQAYAIDGLILFVPLLGLWAVVLPPLVRRAGDDPALQDELDVWIYSDDPDPPVVHFLLWILAIVAAAVACYWVLMAIYSGVFLSRTAGQTPGRRAAGIRVMRADGRPVGFWWAIYRTVLVREILFGIGSLLSGGLVTLLQYGWPLWDDERRALHDMVARSRVVQDADR